MVTAIEVRALVLRHAADTPVLFDNLSFVLAKGEALVLLGRNGTGKTTLLKCLAGLMRPHRGAIACLGSIGYVPQHFATPFDYTARDIVLMGRARHVGLFAAPGPADHRHADAAIRLIGLDALADRTVATLSGGERQLVLLARAVASEAEILLLDEPASALDFHNQATMLALLARLCRERAMTVVMTTHDPTHALELADRVLAVHGGGRWAEGPVAEICSEENLSELYGLAMKRLAYRSGDATAHAIAAHYGIAERLAGTAPEPRSAAAAS